VSFSTSWNAFVAEQSQCCKGLVTSQSSVRRISPSAAWRKLKQRPVLPFLKKEQGVSTVRNYGTVFFWQSTVLFFPYRTFRTPISPKIVTVQNIREKFSFTRCSSCTLTLRLELDVKLSLRINKVWIRCAQGMLENFIDWLVKENENCFNINIFLIEYFKLNQPIN